MSDIRGQLPRIKKECEMPDEQKKDSEPESPLMTYQNRAKELKAEIYDIFREQHILSLGQKARESELKNVEEKIERMKQNGAK